MVNQNVTSSAPVLNKNNPNIMNVTNLNDIMLNKNNAYYNPYINQFAYGNAAPGLSYLNMPRWTNNQVNYTRNILPNNFQGKIPGNQYLNYQQPLNNYYPSKYFNLFQII